MAAYPSNEALGKCVVTNCEQFLLTLNESHHLSLWSIDSLTIVWHCGTVAINNFSVLNDGTNGKSISILALTDESEGGHCQATLYTVPNMECLYSVRLESFVMLASCSHSVDGFFLVEGDGGGGGKDGSVGRLRVRSLTEALPESRLQRMLGKKCFNEAEEFAKRYELDVQVVYQAKADHLLILLSPRSKNDLDEDAATAHVLVLKECLGLVTDDGFVVDRCISAALPSLEMMHDLLEHVKMRLMQKRQSGPEPGRLMKKVTETAHRLGTFQAVFTDGSYGGFKWEGFRNGNMLLELAGYLENGRMHAVSTIWKRHRSDFEQHLSGLYVEQLLLKVPEETPSEKLRDWLSKGLIPFAIQSLPEALPAIATWIGERARNMEIMERSGWPRNALEFCELLVASFKMMSASWEQGLFTPDMYAAQVRRMTLLGETHLILGYII